MTQFGSSSPDSPARRDGVRGVSTGGITESVQIATVPTVAANTGNLVTLESLDRILSITGQALGAVNTAIARKTATINENNAQVDMLDRALANRHARFDSDKFGAMIDQGQLKVPDGVSIEDYSTAVVKDEMAKTYDKPSDAYRREYEDLAPVLAGRFTAKQKRDRSQAQADNLDLMTDRVFASKSAAEVQEAVAFSAANFGVTERQAQASIVIPAMRQAASTGDMAKVEMLAASLPAGSFAGDIDQLKLAAQSAQNQKQNQEWSKGEDILQSLLDANVSTTMIRDSVTELHDSGQLAPGKAEQWRRIMDTRDAQAQSIAKAAAIDTIASLRLAGATREQLEPQIKRLEQIDPSAALAARDQMLEAEAKIERQRVEQEKILFKQGVVAEGVAAAGTGYLGSVGDVRMLASDGKTELHANAGEVKQMALDAVFAQIDREESAKFGGNYAAAFQSAQARKVRVVGANGVLPESFSQTLSAGAAAAQPQAFMEGKVPPATVAAYSLYRQMLADAPAIAERAAQGKAKELFDNAVILQSDFKDKDGKDDIAGALAAAARNVYADPMVKAGAMRGLTDDTVHLAAKSMVGRSWGQAIAYNATGGIIPLVPGMAGRAKNDVRNMPEVEAAIRTRAAAYLPTKTPEEAIKIAASRVALQGQVVDGWWTRFTGDISDRTKSALPEVVADKADEWVKANPNGAVGRENIRVTMEPSGQFALIDNSTGFPLSPPVLLTASQVDAAFSEKRRIEADKASAKARRDTNHPNSIPNQIKRAVGQLAGASDIDEQIKAGKQ